MESTMNAAVVRALGAVPHIEEVPVPRPGPGQWCLPHGPARRRRRLAGEAEVAVHPRA
jgi:hypothetical protein